MQNLQLVTAVVDAIEADLFSCRWGLAAMAAAMHYSKYHLHRLFAGTVGLTIHQYALRRRLTEAARALVFTGEPVVQLAQMAGYESQRAFTAAFRLMYKQTPGQFRRRGVFYPLQLRFALGGAGAVPRGGEMPVARRATEADVDGWLALAHLAIDGYPCLEDEEHTAALRRCMGAGGALVLENAGHAVGLLMVDRAKASIDFMAAHPLYRCRGGAQALVQAARRELGPQRAVSTVTFREGDKADTGQRKELLELGFAPAEFVTGFGYPAQRMVLPKGDA